MPQVPESLGERPPVELGPQKTVWLMSIKLQIEIQGEIIQVGHDVIRRGWSHGLSGSGYSTPKARPSPTTTFGAWEMANIS